jgi:hypothetical protein
MKKEYNLVSGELHGTKYYYITTKDGHGCLMHYSHADSKFLYLPSHIANISASRFFSYVYFKKEDAEKKMRSFNENVLLSFEVNNEGFGELKIGNPSNAVDEFFITNASAYARVPEYTHYILRKGFSDQKMIEDIISNLEKE